MANFKAGRWAVKEVINKLCGMGKFAKQYVPKDADIWGEEPYEGPDYIFLNGVMYTCPDVEIYRDSTWTDVVMRVEVKSFENYKKYKNRNENFFCIKESSILKYLKLERNEKIPIRVIFVLGSEKSGKVEYFWETLRNLVYVCPNEILNYKGSFDEFETLHYFWKAENLRRDF